MAHGESLIGFIFQITVMIVLSSTVSGTGSAGMNPNLLLYNRIPKSGSEYMLFVLSKLGKEKNNNFTMHGGGTVTEIGISLTDQVRKQYNHN